MGLEDEKSQPFKSDSAQSNSIESTRKFEISLVENESSETPSVEIDGEELKTSENLNESPSASDTLLEGLF